jgi:hypothetical protein
VPHSLWWLAVDAGCVYRLTILATKDIITEPFRRRLGRPFTALSSARSGVRWWLFELANCPWCVSVWAAAGVVTLTATAASVWQYAAAAFALSGITGFLAER